jgi:hypothetical protein
LRITIAGTTDEISLSIFSTYEFVKTPSDYTTGSSTQAVRGICALLGDGNADRMAAFVFPNRQSGCPSEFISSGVAIYRL